MYNGLDCCVTLEIRDQLLPLLDSTTRKTYEFSLSLQAPIMEMGLRGLLVDKTQRDNVLRKIRQDIMTISAQLDAIVTDGIGLELNWRSPVQVKKLLYQVMGLPVVRKRNASGIMAPTANREALEKLSQHFIAEPITIRLLALRDLDKKRQFLETEIDPDGRSRTSMNIAGTDTGRLSSSLSEFGTGGNQQNIDRDLRTVFIPDPGYKFGNIDLEQGDARNVGAICWDLFFDSDGPEFAGSYLDACESGDLHTTVCRMAWHNLAWTDDPKANKKVAEQIAYRNDSYRQLAKKLGHGTNYYGTPPTMARHTKVERKIIEEFQKLYFTGFKCITKWHQHVRKQLLTSSQLTTLFGRRRTFFGRPQDDTTLRAAIACNPQSMTAEQINIAMLRLWRENKIQLLVQVHDSLLFQYKIEHEAEVLPWAIALARVTLELKGGRKFTVPTDAKVGWNWGDVEYDKNGKVIGNPNGLIKWTGKDDRVFQMPKKLSIKDLLL